MRRTHSYRRLCAVAAAGLLAGGLAACSSSSSSSSSPGAANTGTATGKTLVMESSPETAITQAFNPFITTEPAWGMGATGLIYEPLIQFNLAAPPKYYPQLVEGVLEKVGDVETFVRLEQNLQRSPSFQSKVRPTRQQIEALPLDEATFPPFQASVLGTSHFIHGVSQVAKHMELVIDDQRPRSISLLEGGRAEWLPHVHDGDANFPAICRAKPDEEGIETLLGAVFAAEPNGPATDQIADDDAIVMAWPHGDFVDADRRRALDAHAPELLVHVLLVQLLDGVPIEQQLLGKLTNRGRTAASPHVVGESFGVQRIVRQPFE